MTFQIKKKYTTLMIVLICIIFSFSLSYPQEKAQNKYFELKNGLKVFLLQKRTLPLINLVFGVNLGSKDETDETNGLVHVLEHYILFRGTKFKSRDEIIKGIRRHGAYINAHTGRDLTYFEISLPSDHADFALKNQKEMLFELKMTQKELDEEKKIILEELNQIHDDPIKYSTSLVFQNLFKNHPYQMPLHGKKEIIKAATAEQIEKFYRKHFVPSNCALAVVGKFNIEDMEKKIKRTFGDLKNPDFVAAKYGKVQFLKKTVEIKQEMDVNQAYLTIGIKGAGYNNPDQYAIDILTEIIGRGANPMLYAHLNERVKLVNNIIMSYSAHKYGGAILIYLTLDPKHLKNTKRKVFQFLKDTRRKKFSKEDFSRESQLYALDYLEYAKNQIKFTSHRSREKGLSVAFSLSRFMLLSESHKQENYFKNINNINAFDLRRIAGKYLGEGRYVIVTIVPKKKKNI